MQPCIQAICEQVKSKTIGSRHACKAVMSGSSGGKLASSIQVQHPGLIISGRQCSDWPMADSPRKGSLLHQAARTGTGGSSPVYACFFAVCFLGKVSALNDSGAQSNVASPLTLKLGKNRSQGGRLACRRAWREQCQELFGAVHRRSESTN